MRLIFRRPYLSITSLDAITLPGLCVLTGVNGSGKSHLLEAIERRDVDIENQSQARVIRFNYESFRLDNEAAFNAQQLHAEREAAWDFFQGNMKGPLSSLRNSLGNEYAPMKEACAFESRHFLELENPAITRYRTDLDRLVKSDNFKSNAQALSVFSLAHQIPYAVDEIERSAFVRLFKPFQYKNDFLPQQLGKVIWDYYVQYRDNEVNRYCAKHEGKEYPFLEEPEYLKAHGPKPWDVMNEILKAFDTLEYRVSSPEGMSQAATFQLRLVHTSNPALAIDFSGLSSGEKILMALVASVYKASTDRVFPDVLLLDEIDASLHPSMMRNMLKVIRDIFLARGVQVILVTHSPTTIALAPEESVYVMNKSGPNRIEKRSRSDALSILTEGFATLEEGIRLFDQISKSKVSIITEGYNSALIERALKLHNCPDVEVISGFEGASGKNQLKTLFDFFIRAEHKTKVIFVWDCDARYSLETKSNTVPYFLTPNPENLLAPTGIENMFPQVLLPAFCKTVTFADGRPPKTEFDASMKRKFEEFVLERNAKSDFLKFTQLVQLVESLKAA